MIGIFAIAAAANACFAAAGGVTLAARIIGSHGEQCRLRIPFQPPRIRPVCDQPKSTALNHEDGERIP